MSMVSGHNKERNSKFAVHEGLAPGLDQPYTLLVVGNEMATGGHRHAEYSHRAYTYQNKPER